LGEKDEAFFFSRLKGRLLANEVKKKKKKKKRKEQRKMKKRLFK
jgi:hypothetical protein